MGISSEEVRHLFKPFFRASNGRFIWGTGLWLYISAALIERFGGAIDVGRNNGGASVLSVRLPLAMEYARALVSSG